MEMIGDLASLARQLEQELAARAFSPMRTDKLPDCMMPDGADPCEGYKELSDQLMRWFKAASPYATPGSLETALRRFHHWQDQMNKALQSAPPANDPPRITLSDIDRIKREGPEAVLGEPDATLIDSTIKPSAWD